MGVVTLLRNDAALSADVASVGDFLLPDVDKGKDVTPAVELCTGRVLVLETKPTGARGAVWHVNVYQYTSSAPVAKRRAVWEACTAVIQEAAAQGAAVVIGGDFNATTGQAQRSLSSRRVDQVCQEWIRANKGVAAHPSRTDNEAGRLSWMDPRGRHDADLDHIAVFPSTIPVSHRRLLPALEAGLDHLPVVASFPTACLGEQVHIEAGPRHHISRVQTQDFL